MQGSYNRTALVSHIVEQLQSGVAADKLSPALAAYLLTSGKSHDLPSIMRDAQELRAHKYGVIELTTRSAHDLDAERTAEIERIAKDQYPSAKSVTIHTEHDDSVVGGVNLTLPQASLDISIRNKLNQLREAIT